MPRGRKALPPGAITDDAVGLQFIDEPDQVAWIDEGQRSIPKELEPPQRGQLPSDHLTAATPQRPDGTKPKTT